MRQNRKIRKFIFSIPIVKLLLCALLLAPPMPFAYAGVIKNREITNDGIDLETVTEIVVQNLTESLKSFDTESTTELAQTKLKQNIETTEKLLKITPKTLNEIIRTDGANKSTRADTNSTEEEKTASSPHLQLSANYEINNNVTEKTNINYGNNSDGDNESLVLNYPTRLTKLSNEINPKTIPIPGDVKVRATPNITTNGTVVSSSPAMFEESDSLRLNVAQSIDYMLEKPLKEESALTTSNLKRNDFINHKAEIPKGSTTTEPTDSNERVNENPNITLSIENVKAENIDAPRSISRLHDEILPESANTTTDKMSASVKEESPSIVAQIKLPLNKTDSSLAKNLLENILDYTTTTISTASNSSAAASKDLRTNEILTTTLNSTRASEKSGKFISFNSTNTNKLNLPELAEVWSLAGMKSVTRGAEKYETSSSILVSPAPPPLVATPSTAMNDNKIEIETQSVQNESSFSGNSEKNLLDWSNIMLSENAGDDAIDLIGGDKFEKFNTNGSTELKIKTPGQKLMENKLNISTSVVELPKSSLKKPTVQQTESEIDTVSSTVMIFNDSSNAIEPITAAGVYSTTKDTLLVDSTLDFTTSTIATFPELDTSSTDDYAVESTTDSETLTNQSILSMADNVSIVTSSTSTPSLNSASTITTATSTTTTTVSSHSVKSVEMPTTLAKPSQTTESHNKSTTTEKNVVVETTTTELSASTTFSTFSSLETTTEATEEATKTPATGTTYRIALTEADITPTIANEMLLNGNSNYKHDNKTGGGGKGNEASEIFEKIADNSSLQTAFGVSSTTTTHNQFAKDNNTESSPISVEKETIEAVKVAVTSVAPLADTTASKYEENVERTSPQLIISGNELDLDLDFDTIITNSSNSARNSNNSNKYNSIATTTAKTETSSISLSPTIVVNLTSTNTYPSSSPQSTVFDINSQSGFEVLTKSTDTESSIETNVIDIIGQTTTTTTTVISSTAEPQQQISTPTHPKHMSSTEEDYNEQTYSTIGEFTSTTMETNMAPDTSSPSSPLIELLSTTTLNSVSSNEDNVYFIFSTSSTTNETPLPTSTTTIKSTSEEVFLATEILNSTDSAVPTRDDEAGVVVGVGSNLNPEDAQRADMNVIIAVSVSAVGIIAVFLVVAILYVMRKRQKQMSYSQRCRPVSLDAYSLDNVSVYNSVRRKGALRSSKRSYGNVAFDDPSLRHNILSTIELGKFVERRSSIFEEFRDIPQITVRADEVPHGCEDKNRYANVVPLPETRVILQQQNDDERTEYINANYVRGPKDTPNYYIACQAPLESTVVDFWRMIWEQNSRVIIMATDLIENGIEKCAEYLPPSVTLDNHTVFGDYQITLKNREIKEKYAQSTIILKDTTTNTSRELTHFWYQWPETGVPSDEATIIAMLLEARRSLKKCATEKTNEYKAADITVSENNSSLEKPTTTANGETNGNGFSEKLKSSSKTQGPLTIHCSPGTGRTGTIIACDIAIRSLETPKRSVDIPQIVYYVRRGRASAVQTKEQYEFIYKVANLHAKKISHISNDN